MGYTQRLPRDLVRVLAAGAVMVVLACGSDTTQKSGHEELVGSVSASLDQATAYHRFVFSAPYTVASQQQPPVPIYLGEFGVISECFDNDPHGNNRGGLTWVRDVLDIVLLQNVHFTYHDYHERNFGVFRSNPASDLPHPQHERVELSNLFKAKLLPLQQ